MMFSWSLRNLHATHCTFWTTSVTLLQVPTWLCRHLCEKCLTLPQSIPTASERIQFPVIIRRRNSLLDRPRRPKTSKLTDDPNTRCISTAVQAQWKKLALVLARLLWIVNPVLWFSSVQWIGDCCKEAAGHLQVSGVDEPRPVRLFSSMHLVHLGHCCSYYGRIESNSVFRFTGQRRPGNEIWMEQVEPVLLIRRCCCSWFVWVR